ncbi:MAG: hypothetical protein Q8L47_02565 [bacterium]|nr:hypothetical protein [bacterium]
MIAVSRYLPVGYIGSQPRTKITEKEECVSNVIHAPDEFLRQLKVGDQFYHITSYCGAPQSIEGPVTITRFEVGKYSPRVHLTSLRGEDVIHVGDLTNDVHGVFVAYDDAIAYFNERKTAYETDPALIAAVKQQEDEARWFSDWGEDITD